jgi:hypothetical membrane protein
MRAHAITAWVFLGLLALQFFLAGIGIFGAGSFDPHAINGTLMLVVALVLLILAAVRRLGRPIVTMSAVLLLLTLVQGFLPAARDDAPVLAALHPVNALVLLVLAHALARGSTVADLRSAAR